MSGNVIISLHDLKTQFGSQVIHDHLNLDIYKGEILGIVGGSGAGKSVLLRTILGLTKPKSGEIKVLGQKVGTMERVTQTHMQAHWGVLFQNGALFSSMTVGENIQIPMKELEKMPADLARELAMIKLKMVGLSEDDFYKAPAELSGGMVKRVALARALAVDPEILFLDEPTAGLDPISASAFDELILQLRDNLGLTVVLVTHDLDTLFTICDRVAVLVDKNLCVGRLEDVIQEPHPWIQQYFHGIRGRAVQSSSKKET